MEAQEVDESHAFLVGKFGGSFGTT